MSAHRPLGEFPRQGPHALPRPLAESFRDALERAAGDDEGALRRWLAEHGRELGLEVRCPTKTRPDGRVVLACPRDCPCDGAGHYVRPADWDALLQDLAAGLPGTARVASPGPGPRGPAPAAADPWQGSQAASHPATDFTWPVDDAGRDGREMFAATVPRRRWFRRREKAPKPRSFDPGPTWFERLLWMLLVAAAIGLGVFFYWHA